MTVSVYEREEKHKDCLGVFMQVSWYLMFAQLKQVSSRTIIFYRPGDLSSFFE